MESAFLPFVKAHKRANTHKGYEEIWRIHLSTLCGDSVLRRVRTCDVQQWLDIVAASARTKVGAVLTKTSLQRAKSFFSGSFAYAISQGFMDGVNRAGSTHIPTGLRDSEETFAHSLEDIIKMILVLPEPHSTLIAVAGFTGVRRGEIRGMDWSGYRNGAIYVSRCICEDGTITKVKTKASKDGIPVAPVLAAILERHWRRLGSPSSGPIFSGVRCGKPVSLNNALRIIKPILNRCGVCLEPESKHSEETGHKYERDASLPKWRGWHAFRRGVATNLHDLSVDDKTIQAVLRHSDVAVTQRCYIKSFPKQAVAAMGVLNEKAKNMFAECALQDAESAAGAANK
jgi:integrase